MKCPNCATELTLSSPDPEHLEYHCPRCSFTVPANYLKIDALFAYVSVDPKDGNEGILAAQSMYGLVPLVGADEARMKSHRELARAAAKKMGIKVRLLRFSTREVLEEL